jgi:hypothetical protein
MRQEDTAMRSASAFGFGLALVLSGCADGRLPTQPDAADPALAAAVAAASNSWAPRTPRPGVPLFGTVAAVAPNAAGHSIVYVFGGTDGEGGTGFGTSAYDATTDTWGAVPSPGCAIHGFEVNGVAKIGNRMYLSGGYTYVETKTTLHSTYACNYAHGGLSQKADLPFFSAQGVSGAIDGKLYVLPGFCSGEVWPHPGYCETEPNRRFYRYDPAANTWQQRADAPHSHRSGASAVLGGKLYVAAGYRGEGGFIPVNTADVYEPATNAWRTIAPLPVGGRAVGAALQGRFFVVVGGHAYAYSPSTNSWQAKAAPRQGPDALVAVSVGGSPRLIAVGQDATELYTP